MTQTTVYFPQGVCSQKFEISATDGMIDRVVITGGCDGNLKAIAALLPGMTPAEAIRRLSGITCDDKNTSCPDQLAAALQALL